MLPMDCFVKISWVKAYLEGAIRLLGVGQGRYSVGWVTGVISLRVSMLSRVFSIWLWYSVGTFCQACWTGGMDGSVQIVYVLGMSKERGEGTFKG